MPIETLCIVQSGQVSDAQRETLESRLNQIARDTFGEEAAASWLVIEPGNGWTAAKPSTSALVSMNVPPMDEPDRTQLLHNICGAWSEETHCSLNEIVASAITAPEGE